MQIIKPDTVSLLYNTYGYHGDQFVVTAMSFFKLGEDNQLLIENNQWARLQPWLDKQLILDTGHAKACGEILLAGSAYAPDGEPVTQMQVGIEIDGLAEQKVKKAIKVVGNRETGKKGLLGKFKVSDPEPFTQMPLGFEQCYGGEGFELNTSGKGSISSSESGADDNDKNWLLPNLYLQAESTKPDKQPRTVACFLPQSIDHPNRLAYQGTYDQRWLDEVQPGFPDDTNPLFFNAAPAEQLIEGYFSPGQGYLLSGMHPEKAVIEGNIPTVHVRAFVTQTQQDGADVFKEIKTLIDTLWFFPELELGIAIHRGVMPAGDSAGLDIKNLMLALENVEDTPRELGYFEKVRNLRLNKKTSVGNLFNATQLLPQLKPQEIKRRANLFVEAKKQLEQKRQKLRVQMFKKLKSDSPDIDVDDAMAKDPHKDGMEDEPPPIPKELIEKRDFDLTPYLDWAKSQSLKNKALIKASLAELEKIKAENPPVPIVFEEDEEILGRINDVVLVSTTEPDTALADLENESDQEKLTRVEMDTKKSQRLARQKAASFEPSPSLSEHAGEFIREQVLLLIEKGEPLAGRDLAGADLSNLEFVGLDFTDVMLEQADLTGAKFSNCCFDGAALTCALLENTVVTACSFIKANLSNVNAKDTLFHDCLFDHSSMQQSQFNACKLTGSKFIKIQAMDCDWQQSLFYQTEFQAVQVVECNLKQTAWQQANLIQVTLMQCDFQESDWQQANLFRCVMVKSQANKANFCGVSAQRVQFSTEGDFSEAEFSAGNWEQSGFRGLNLSQSDLSASVFKNCDFGDANLTGARLTGALFHNSLLFQVNFMESDCTETVFHQSNMRKSSFKKAILRRARINQSNLREVTFEDCDTEQLQRSKAPSLT